MAKARLLSGVAAWVAICLPAAAGVAGEPAQNKENPEVEKVLAKYRAVRPSADDLAVYGLDWLPTLKAAREKAAKENRPILLMVVRNSFGNLHSGHC